MDDNGLKKYVATGNITIVQAMEKIDRNSAGILYIVDADERLVGSLTDGDIRRWIIKTGKLEGQASQVLHKDVRYVFESETDGCRRMMEHMKVNSLPVVDSKLHIKEIVFQKEFLKARAVKENCALKNIPVIIMAGGKGTRLYPYTKILPKPLIPVGEVPILERILKRFHEFGADEFYLTVNYRKEMIKSYFNEMKHDYTIHYVEEDKPLGTAGSIKLIEKNFCTPIVITNCDTLIEADYGKVLEYHRDSGNELTIISSLKNTSIPYGVLHCEKNGIITSIEEKPRLSYFINTGMYIINPEHIEWIPEDRVYHMTDLIGEMMKRGRQVGMYPVSEYSFLDMGEFEEMKKMEERINRKPAL